MTAIITGAPKIAVTVLILISVGANTIRARRSQNMQNTAPPKKHAGIMMIGFAVPNKFLTSCYTVECMFMHPFALSIRHTLK